MKCRELCSLFTLILIIFIFVRDECSLMGSLLIKFIRSFPEWVLDTFAFNGFWRILKGRRKIMNSFHCCVCVCVWYFGIAQFNFTRDFNNLRRSASKSQNSRKKKKTKKQQQQKQPDDSAADEQDSCCTISTKAKRITGWLHLLSIWRRKQMIEVNKNEDWGV